MKPGVNACTFCLGMALFAALPAHASPFSVGLPASAERGTSITASLLDGGVTQGSIQPVPEPTSSTLVAMGLLALMGWSRRLR